MPDIQNRVLITSDIILNSAILKYIYMTVNVDLKDGQRISVVFKNKNKDEVKSLSFILPESAFIQIQSITLVCDLYEQYMSGNMIYDVAKRTFVNQYTIQKAYEREIAVHVLIDAETIAPSSGQVINGYISIYNEEGQVWFNTLDDSLQHILSFVSDDKSLLEEVFGPTPAEVQRSIIYTEQTL